MYVQILVYIYKIVMSSLCDLETVHELLNGPNLRQPLTSLISGYVIHEPPPSRNGYTSQFINYSNLIRLSDFESSTRNESFPDRTMERLTWIQKSVKKVNFI